MLDGHGRPQDIALLLDLCDNISPAIAWPPKQTTLCPLSPPAFSPIARATMRFQPQFPAYCGGGDIPTSVTLTGQHSPPPPETPAGSAGDTESEHRGRELR